MNPTAAPLVTFHLFGVATRRVPAALARMALDRADLRRTPGLRFAKLVGTGSGDTFTVRDADPHRWGLVASWDDARALARFERAKVLRAWSRISTERWHVELVPLRSKGRWAGQDPFSPPAPAPPGADSAVAALTRARIRWPLARTFWRAVPPVASALQSCEGLRFAVGFGEAPVGLQGTFSLWNSDRALTAFAYDGMAHREAIAATQRLGWYREELFARFAVVGSAGTVDGRDPLADGPPHA